MPGRSYGLVFTLRGANRGDKDLSAMGRILYWRCVLQAASIQKDLTDNELDEVLNAKTSLIKELQQTYKIQQINGTV
jgi:hypothetical protein